ncbi:MAG: DUF5660 domain-containing protein [Ignavibacteria bacterium]|nr:DUF5660 domain-containing protein [Ignavibacteria bacterium]
MKDLGSSTVKNTFDSMSSIGGGMLDQFFGSNEEDEKDEFKLAQDEIKKNKGKKDFKLFSYTEYSETTLIKQKISELTDLIKREIDYLKRDNSSLLNEVKDVEKLTINDLPEKPGIYHIRFLEVVLNVIRHLRAKVGESRTWLDAMTSKRKKRGSLFAVRSKKAGTQYSQSQELQNARSVQ